MMKIFEPFEINSMKLKNRIVRSATWLAGCPTGDVTDELILRYAEMAAGGCALIITGFAFVSPEGAMLPAMIGTENDSRISSLAKLTEAVHAAEKDVKIFCQLAHTGIFRLPVIRTTYADTFAADETIDPFVEMGGTGETCPAAPAMMEKHLRTTCDAFAISRPILQDPEVVNKWIEDPEHLTGCVSCNKCSQKIEGMIVCRKDE